MRTICMLLFGVAGTVSLFAEQLLPTGDGTTWNYEASRETNDSSSLELSESTKTDRFSVSYKITGRQKFEGKDLIKLAVYGGETLSNTDLMTMDDQGIVCHGRLDEKGAAEKFETPQILLPAPPLKAGDSWNFDGKVGGTEVSQHYQVGDEEDVVVPAGEFRAWKIHCEQTSPTPAIIDRWFAPGTGFVKMITTIRSSSGELLQRTSLQLKEQPKVAALPTDKSVAELGALSVGLSKEPEGEFTTTFNSNAPAIYARWQGHELAAQAEIRAVWVAEKVPDVAANSEVDDAEAVAPSPNAHGTFTLAQPEGGWTPGDYRVEFYVDDAPAVAIKLKIVK